ncbi:MAG: hypothetical protein N4A47_03200 [Clostridia bacterium]|jgi:hypothetical protein|nr:hypothetical protein [Clostridia bacterium]
MSLFNKIKYHYNNKLIEQEPTLDDLEKLFNNKVKAKIYLPDIDIGIGKNFIEVVKAIKEYTNINGKEKENEIVSAILNADKIGFDNKIDELGLANDESIRINKKELMKLGKSENEKQGLVIQTLIHETLHFLFKHSGVDEKYDGLLEGIVEYMSLDILKEHFGDLEYDDVSTYDYYKHIFSIFPEGMIKKMCVGISNETIMEVYKTSFKNEKNFAGFMEGLNILKDEESKEALKTILDIVTDEYSYKLIKGMQRRSVDKDYIQSVIEDVENFVGASNDIYTKDNMFEKHFCDDSKDIILGKVEAAINRNNINERLYDINKKSYEMENGITKVERETGRFIKGLDQDGNNLVIKTEKLVGNIKRYEETFEKEDGSTIEYVYYMDEDENIYPASIDAYNYMLIEIEKMGEEAKAAFTKNGCTNEFDGIAEDIEELGADIEVKLEENEKTDINISVEILSLRESNIINVAGLEYNIENKIDIDFKADEMIKEEEEVGRAS